jgi:tRNA pseudouridine38-40 synthase
MNKKTFKCTVAYRGTHYYGWQRQSKVVTVQGMIEYALQKFFGKEIKTAGASRTDAGVHAYGQVMSMQVETKMTAHGVMCVLNGLLPPDIRIMRCVEEEGFNARWNVRKKFYRYIIHNSAVTYPVYDGLCWELDKKLDIAGMQPLLPLFKGEKNYFSFSSSGSGHSGYIRTVDDIKIKKQGRWVMIDFKAKSFLYNMIRKIMSALVSCSLGEMTKQDVEKMFKNEDRSVLRHMAPPGGLYLVKIIYNKSGSCNVERGAENETQDED